MNTDSDRQKREDEIQDPLTDMEISSDSVDLIQKSSKICRCYNNNDMSPLWETLLLR